MDYGYARVSTITQNVGRQLEALAEFGIPNTNIFIDRESGKDFARVNYRKMLRKLRRNDVVYIKSIDRLGRNYAMILDEWRFLTKEKGVNIVVLDMPLLDTREKGKNLMGNFIADVVLQVLSFVAENERENIRQRQMEGIRLAKQRGVKFGRPKIVLSDDFKSILKKYKRKEITSDVAISMSKVSRGTFFRRLKEFLSEKQLP